MTITYTIMQWNNLPTNKLPKNKFIKLMNNNVIQRFGTIDGLRFTSTYSSAISESDQPLTEQELLQKKEFFTDFGSNLVDIRCDQHIQRVIVDLSSND